MSIHYIDPARLKKNVLTLNCLNVVFRSFLRCNPRWAPIVYRLISEALIGIFFHYPFLIQNSNISHTYLIWHARQLRVKMFLTSQILLTNSVVVPSLTFVCVQPFESLALPVCHPPPVPLGFGCGGPEGCQALHIKGRDCFLPSHNLCSQLSQPDIVGNACVGQCSMGHCPLFHGAKLHRLNGP